LTKTSGNYKIIDNARNPSAWGYSSDGKYFVLITQQSNAPSPPSFYLSLFDTTQNSQNPVSIPGYGNIGAVLNADIFKFSPSGNYFVLGFVRDFSTTPNIHFIVFNLNQRSIPVDTTIFLDRTIFPGSVQSGFSSKGNAFLVTWNPSPNQYSLRLFNTDTSEYRKPAVLGFDSTNANFATFLFSPCGSLFMVSSRQSSTSNPNADFVNFYFTTNGERYSQVSLDSTATSDNPPSATAANGKIQLTGTRPTSIDLPRC
jgi:hypothetical protein